MECVVVASSGFWLLYFILAPDGAVLLDTRKALNLFPEQSGKSLDS